MWWEPTSSWEEALAADVRRLRGWFVKRPRERIQLAWGVGSIWSSREGALGRGDDLRIEGIPNGRQIRFKADFWRVSFGRRSTSG